MTTIRDLLSRDLIEKAIDTLLDSQYKEKFYGISGRFHRNETAKNDGEISESFYNTERNRIRNSLLSMLTENQLNIQTKDKLVENLKNMKLEEPQEVQDSKITTSTVQDLYKELKNVNAKLAGRVLSFYQKIQEYYTDEMTDDTGNFDWDGKRISSLQKTWEKLLEEKQKSQVKEVSTDNKKMQEKLRSKDPAKIAEVCDNLAFDDHNNSEMWSNYASMLRERKVSKSNLNKLILKAQNFLS